MIWEVAELSGGSMFGASAEVFLEPEIPLTWEACNSGLCSEASEGVVPELMKSGRSVI